MATPARQTNTVLNAKAGDKFRFASAYHCHQRVSVPGFARTQNLPQTGRLSSVKGTGGASEMTLTNIFNHFFIPLLSMNSERCLS